MVPPTNSPRPRAVFPSSLRAISRVSRLSDSGEYRAIKSTPIIKSLSCEKITPHAKTLKRRKKIRHLTGIRCLMFSLRLRREGSRRSG